MYKLDVKKIQKNLRNKYLKCRGEMEGRVMVAKPR
jgi:hypothetical protein